MSDSKHISFIEYVNIQLKSNRELTDARITALEKQQSTSDLAAAKALDLAKEDVNRHLESLNGLQSQLKAQSECSRNQLVEQSSKFVTAERYELQHGKISDEIKDLRDWKNVQIGISSSARTWSIVAVVIAAVAAIATLIPLFKH